MTVASETPFTLAELIEFIGQGKSAPHGFLTTDEWCERLGVGERKMRALYKRALRVGALRHERVLRPSSDGVYRWTNLYAFDLQGSGRMKDVQHASAQ